jgi:short-subunit dehydrogenase
LAQLVIPVMLNQKSGVIVTMGSVAGKVALPWSAAYSASKFAMHAVHDALRVELRRTPIHLVKVCAGIVDTDFRKHVLNGEAPQGVLDLRWVVSPEAVALAIFRSVQRRKKSVYVPAIGALFGSIGQFAPGLMDIFLARFLPETPLRGLARKGLEPAKDAER